MENNKSDLNKKKNNNKISKRTIGIIISILIILIIAVVIFVVVSKSDTNNENEQNNVSSKGENVDILYDGTKVNTSPNIKRNRTVDGLEYKNINIVSKANLTTLEADVTNNSGKVNGDYSISIIAKDKDNNTLIKVSGYVNKVEKNETTKLKIKTSFDFATAYDLEIVKE